MPKLHSVISYKSLFYFPFLGQSGQSQIEHQNISLLKKNRVFSGINCSLMFGNWNYTCSLVLIDIAYFRVVNCYAIYTKTATESNIRSCIIPNCKHSQLIDISLNIFRERETDKWERMAAEEGGTRPRRTRTTSSARRLPQTNTVEIGAGEEDAIEINELILEYQLFRFLVLRLFSTPVSHHFIPHSCRKI